MNPSYWPSKSGKIEEQISKIKSGQKRKGGKKKQGNIIERQYKTE